MKEGKTVDEFKRELNKNLSQRKQISYETLIRIARDFLPETSFNEHIDRAEVACQYDNRRRNLTSLCDNNKQDVSRRSQKPKCMLYASRNTGEIGVSSIRILKKRRVKKIYLPETTDAKIGNSDFIITRRSRSSKNRYMLIKKSSKCIGGVVDNHEPTLVHAKISPIIKTKSGVTSPMTAKTYIEQDTNVKTPNTVSVTYVTSNKGSDNKDVKSDNESGKINEKIRYIHSPLELKETPKVESKKRNDTVVVASIVQDTKSPTHRKGIKEFSSNSLLQHVHDLESPCDDRPSFSVTTDPMENKLEREYRKMFSVKNKEKKEVKAFPSDKSASILRRRFDALRRTVKKEQYKNDLDVSKDTLNEVCNTRKDVSINSDPPSLEGRSFYEMKTYSPSPSHETEMYTKPLASFKKSFNIKKLSRTKPTHEGEAETKESSYTQGVKGMFKLWGKKFNLDDDMNKKKSSLKKESAYEKSFPIKESDLKKDGRKFSFFRKKIKDKPANSYIDGVTTGRCEVKDGLKIKIPNMIDTIPRNPDECAEIVRQKWLRKFLSRGIESRDRVHIRWNNNTYKSSSSNTVFELMNTIYKGNGVSLKPQSDVTAELSNDIDVKYYPNKVVHAWMIPQIITFRQLLANRKSSPDKKWKKHKLKLKNCNSKHCIEKAKALEHRTELVLHSNQFKLDHRDSSKYFTKDVTKDMISELSSDDYGRYEQSSDEEVYKIVEYDTPSSSFNKKKGIMQIGDYLCVDQNNEKKTAYKSRESVQNPPNYRDVEIQGSNVLIAKRCGVIRVGIITQREIKDAKKPILKFKNDYSSEEESESYLYSDSQKKCEFAEKYLQDYYRHFTLLGIDFFSWCVSDSHVRCSETHSKINLKLKNDITKSCPNMFEDYQTTVNVSSGKLSHVVEPDDKMTVRGLGSRFFKKFLLKKSRIGRRVLPKDSFEVLKKRRMYSEVKSKTKWIYNNSELDPSNQDVDIKDHGVESKKNKTSTAKKRVMLPEDDFIDKIFEVSSKNKTVGFNHETVNDEISNKELVSSFQQFEPVDITSSLGYNSQNVEPSNQPNSNYLPDVNLPIQDPNQTTNCQSYQMIIPHSSGIMSPEMVKKTTFCKNILTNSPIQNATPKGHEVQKKLSPWNIQIIPSNELRFSKADDFSSLRKSFCSPSVDLKQDCAAYISSEKKQPQCSLNFCPCNELINCRKFQTKHVEHNQCNCPDKTDDYCNTKKLPQSDYSKINKMQHVLEFGHSDLPINKHKVFDEREEIYRHIKSKEEVLKACQKELNELNNKLNKINHYTTENVTPEEKVGEKKEIVNLYSGEQISMKLKTEDSLRVDEIRVIKREEVAENTDESSETKVIKNRQREENTDEVTETKEITKEELKLESTDDVKEAKSIEKESKKKDDIPVVEKDISHKDKMVGDIYSNLDRNQLQIEEKRDVLCITEPTETYEGANLVEIHFKLKLTQGDKTTEIKIEGEHEENTQTPTNLPIQRVQEVYLVKNNKLPLNEEATGKESVLKIKDINIKINIMHTKAANDKKDSLNNNGNSTTGDVVWKTTSERFSAVSPKRNNITKGDNLVSAYSVRKIVIESKHDLPQNKSNEELINTNNIVGNENVDNIKSDSRGGIRKSRDGTSEKSKDKDISIEDISLTRNSSSTDNQDVSLYNNTTEDDEPYLRYQMSKHKYKRKKEMLKKLVAKAADIKRSANKNNIRKFKDMMKAVLTSESDLEDIAVIENELANDVTYTSLKPNYFRNTDSMTNYYTDKSILSETEGISRNKVESTTHKCMCSKIAAKLKLDNARAACCCRKYKTKADACCNISSSSRSSNRDLVDGQTQNSTYVCDKLITTNFSQGYSDFKTEPANLFAQISSKPKNFETQMKRMSKNELRFSERMIIMNTEEELDFGQTKRNETNMTPSSECLQSFETKQAVLEIYAERISTNRGEHFVAKLPKFVYDKESEMKKNYERFVSESFVCTRQ